VSASAIRIAPVRVGLGASDEVRQRTRWTMGVSLALHALLLAFVLAPRPAREAAPELTEITMLSPGDLAESPAGDPAPATAVAREPSPGARVPVRQDESFRRTSDQAELSPDADAISAADRVSARLAAMRQDVSVPVANASAAVTTSAVWTTPAAAAGGGGGNAQALSLTRGGTGEGSTPLALGRGGGTSVSPALAQAGAAPRFADAPATAPEDGDAHARRTLAGAQLAGPIADRAVLRHVTPDYPEWAKRDGVEAAVTLYFIVRPDGSVRENILVQKTAGFGDFDDSARAALAAWRFAPLGGGRTGEQWGTITFHFRLKDV
jgi:TonB family protein